MFQVDIEGFSGPLDLLCHLVESRQLDPMGVKVSDVVKLYVAWLAGGEKVTIDQLGEFILQASKLVLEKTLAIAPPPAPEEEVFDEWDEEDLSDLLERYRPYRAAAKFLAQLWQKQVGRRFRPEQEQSWRYEMGNAYDLALLWKVLLQGQEERFFDFDEGLGIEGVPDAMPPLDQVEVVMERVLERLTLMGETTLTALLEGNRGRGPLAVTLLALLELTRQNKVTLHQEEMFGDVYVNLQPSVATD